MIIDEEAYLEHFGIKGMRWGVRNDRKKKRLSPKNRDRAIKASIVAGAAVAGILMSRIGSTPTREINFDKVGSQMPKFSAPPVIDPRVNSAFEDALKKLKDNDWKT